jgi:hypothetical protein
MVIAESSSMTGNLQAIGFLFTWVLGWGIGGSLIDAGLINAGVYSLDGAQLGTLTTFILWSLLWGGGGVWLYRRWTRPLTPDRCGSAVANRRAVSITMSTWAAAIPVNALPRFVPASSRSLDGRGDPSFACF